MTQKSLRLSIAAAILAVLTSALSPVFALDIIISTLKGTVEVQRKNQSAWQKAQTGTILKSGDKIRTGRRSQAHTISQEGHKITIKEKTVLEITKLGPTEWEFNEEKGRVKLKVAKLGGGQSLRVKTPTALCAVRGTEFEVTVLDDLSTVLDVFEGVVGFSEPGAVTPEMPVLENQRSELQQGAPQPKPAEAIPEEKMKEHIQEKVEEQKKEQTQDQKQSQLPPDPSKLSPEEQKALADKLPADGTQDAMKEGLAENPFRSPLESMNAKEAFRMEVNREVNIDIARDGVESEAAFEQQSNQYQEGKTLIDAFGKRVRQEEYLTRPTPESFKIISISKRDNRTDSATFEVVANRALPDNLDLAGNLWSSFGTVKPHFFAVKQRWHVTNGTDFMTEIALDGDSRPVNFQKPQFTNDGTFLGIINQAGYETIFDHRYQFINGNIGAVERIWNDPAFRPGDNGPVGGTQVAGMMWHRRPILVQMYDPVNNSVQASFWREVFVTGQGAGAAATGKMVFRERMGDPNPDVAHNLSREAYINFVDGNANGYADKGEGFADVNKNGIRDINEPFEDFVQFGLGGTQDLTRAFNSAPDTVLFSDLNRNGLNDDGTAGADPFLVAQRPWAWQLGEEFIINDFGKIINFQEEGLSSISQGSQDQNLIAQTFEKFNYERVFTSSEFNGRKIDVIVSPRALLKAGVVGTTRGGRDDFQPQN